MATLVLTTVGGLVGGPIGAAIGGLIGNAVDHDVLFKPKGREGPRLTELRVQTSSYGTQMPKVFGAMRVAGCVIWSTDLIEHRGTQLSGKGQPSMTSYSYTASFAVALSTRPILRVGRIWADGNLLRGAEGDLKVKTGFRLHLGAEDQAADPLIAAAEGIGLAPAHRGIAYAVFEDLDLTDYGNRIPSLTFEVFAEDGSVATGAIVAELSERLVAVEGVTPALAGFAAYGSDVRAVAEALGDATGAWMRAEPDSLTLLVGDGAALPIGDLGFGTEDRAGTRSVRSIAAADTAPKTVTFSHYEPARDYQAGVQRATRPGAGAVRSQIDLAAALDAASARAMAETMLARFDLERERRSVALGWDALALRPGERVTIEGAAGAWRVDSWSLEAMVLTLECVPIAPGTAVAAPASGGRVLATPDLAIGDTVVEAFELPPLDNDLASVPRIGIAAAGKGAGWRSAALLLSNDDGGSWNALGGTAPPAVIGRVTLPPGYAPATLVDRIHMVELELANPAMILADADAAALDRGANLAMLGDELVQFAHAEPLSGAAWRLSGLWRGRRGTEAAIGAQRIGDRFVLIDRQAIVTADVSGVTLGGKVEVLAQGVGDISAASDSAAISGISVVPPSPVFLRLEESAEGGARLSWIRRSRLGWLWQDGIDAPLGEESERYAVRIVRADGSQRTEEVTASDYGLTAGDRTGIVSIEVRQIGTHGQSAPASLIL